MLTQTDPLIGTFAVRYTDDSTEVVTIASVARHDGVPVVLVLDDGKVLPFSAVSEVTPA